MAERVIDAREAEQLLTAEDLAARWQVPKTQVYALSRRGIIPTVKLGKYYRYRLDAIEAFEQASQGFEAPD